MEKEVLSCIFILFLCYHVVNTQRLPNFQRGQFMPRFQQAPPRRPLTPFFTPKQDTIAVTAERFWKQNQCVYPPKEFYPMFRSACDVGMNDQTFYSGVCHKYFNISKSLCNLEKATAEEMQTMTSIQDLQANIGDDEICDTLFNMRRSDPGLFPHPTGNDDWFEPAYNLIFSSDTCRSVCSLDNAHPICFGILLNYDYVIGVRDRESELKVDDVTDDIISDDTSTDDIISDDTSTDDIINDDTSTDDIIIDDKRTGDIAADGTTIYDVISEDKPTDDAIDLVNGENLNEAKIPDDEGKISTDVAQIPNDDEAKVSDDVNDQKSDTSEIYDYTSDVIAAQTSDLKETEQNEDTDINEENDTISLPDIVIDEIPTSLLSHPLLSLLNTTLPYRPNPKIFNSKATLPSDDYFYELDDVALVGNGEPPADVVLSEALEENPNLLNEILDLGKVNTENLPDYEVEEFELVNGNIQIPDSLMQDIESFSETGGLSEGRQMMESLESLTRLDRSREMPMLSVLLLFSSVLAFLSLFILYRGRKRIASYVRHVRQRRRNNWNYERVLAPQEDDDYYD